MMALLALVVPVGHVVLPFHHHGFEIVVGQLVRRGRADNAAADDRYVNHVCPNPPYLSSPAPLLWDRHKKSQSKKGPLGFFALTLFSKLVFIIAWQISKY